MKQTLGALVLLAVFVAAVACFAPATLVDRELAARTGGQLRLADASGTMWRGRGALVPSNGRWSIPVAWKLDPLALVARVVDAELTDGASGRLRITTDSATFMNVRAAAPARVLGTFPGGERTRIGGELGLRADQLTLAADRGGGSVALEWRNARVGVPGFPTVDLGTVTGTLAARGIALAGPVTSRDGEVAVTGDLSLQPQRIDATLRLQPSAGADRELRDALARVGPADASGAVVVRVQRDLR